MPVGASKPWWSSNDRAESRARGDPPAILRWPPREIIFLTPLGRMRKAPMTEKRRRDEPQSGPPNGGRASNLDRALKSIVTVQSSIPEDAFTAETLSDQRSGSGVVIRESGLVLTI